MATICVSVNRLRLMVVSLQGEPARKLHLSHVSNQEKLARGTNRRKHFRLMAEMVADEVTMSDLLLTRGLACRSVEYARFLCGDGGGVKGGLLA